MSKKSKKYKNFKPKKFDHDAAKALAYFWRYGYWIVSLGIGWLLGESESIWFLVFFPGIFIVHGIWTIIIAALWSPHFVYGMQNASHRPMGGYGPVDKEEQREGILVGCIFLGLGLMLAPAFLLAVFSR